VGHGVGEIVEKRRVRETARSVAPANRESLGLLGKGSAKIQAIVGMIDGIAFTTNLQALKASVAAARAGEAGKGFAVVATEVRILAQRSGGAASEIRALIEESRAQVEGGVAHVTDTQKALDAIVESFRQADAAIARIASAAQEQSGGVEEITSAMNQMDEITQSNAAIAEESASSASSL
jgi:methyl-accepting chemotaxis protein